MRKWKYNPQNGEDIFKSQTVLRIYKELLQFNKKKTNNPILKWEKDLNRYFTEEDTQMLTKYVKRCSKPLAKGQMQTKTTMKYHFTLTNVVIWKAPDNDNA